MAESWTYFSIFQIFDIDISLWIETNNNRTIKALIDSEISGHTFSSACSRIVQKTKRRGSEANLSVQYSCMNAVP